MATRYPIEGGCNCGEVRYRITRQPLTVYVCHCHLCQKRTGSAFSMQREDFPTVSIRAGTLDDTSWLKPVVQLWTSCAQAWAIVPGILSFDKQPADFTVLLSACPLTGTEFLAVTGYDSDILRQH